MVPPSNSALSGVALVTGAGTRVGQAIARTLGEAGMDVAVHFHRSREGAEALCRELRTLGRRAEPLAADLHDRAAARALVDETVARFGQLDLLVASAANFDRVPFEEIGDADWDRALGLNLTAPFVLAQRAAPHLRSRRGSIVIITDTDAARPHRHFLPYLVSKGGVSHLVRVLAVELAPDVRVNGVAPGTVLPPVDLDAGEAAALLRRTPLGRHGSAIDVAGAVRYLASAAFVTGHELVVDGGRAL